MRLVKDDWEVGELQEACDITALGFADSRRASGTDVLEYGERWIEGTFFRRARAMGNDIGYDSIVGGGAHATTLHWIENTGPITPGELVLLDMGVEGRNLYTADVTRTLPVDGTFTPLQRDLYTWCSPPSRPASTPYARVRRSRRRTTRRCTCSRTASRTWAAAGLGRGGARPRTARSTPAGRCTAPATCSAWTCTTARRPPPRRYPQGDLGRGHGAHRRARACTSRRTTCWSPRSCAASASGSRTTSWSPPSGRNLSAALPRDVAGVEEWMGALRA